MEGSKGINNQLEHKVFLCSSGKIDEVTWEYRGRNHCGEQGCHAAQVNGGPGLHKNEVLIMLSDSEGGWHGEISERR